MGRTVTLLEAGPRLVGRAVGQETSAYLLEHHRARGHRRRARRRRTPHRRRAATGSAGVELADGTHVPADLVLVGVGVIPNTELAESIGLACDNGVRVDRSAIASDGVTVAVGDCANQPNPSRVPRRATGSASRASTTPIEQAKVAAYAITGRPRGVRRHPVVLVQPGRPQAPDRRPVDGARPHARPRATPSAASTRSSTTAATRSSPPTASTHPLDFMAVQRRARQAGRRSRTTQAADPAVQLKSVTVDPPRSSRRNEDPHDTTPLPTRPGARLRARSTRRRSR